MRNILLLFVIPEELLETEYLFVRRVLHCLDYESIGLMYDFMLLYIAVLHFYV
jgi:hypothetical protein